MSITNTRFINSFLSTLSKSQENSNVRCNAVSLIDKVKEEKRDNEDSWQNVKQRLHRFYGDTIYKNWIKPIEFTSLASGEVVLSVPTGFVRDWVVTNYSSNILEFWKLEDRSVLSLDVQIKKINSQIKDATSSNPQLLKSSIERVDKMSAPLDRSKTFDSFIVGKSNELAFAAAKQIADSESPVQGSNPLFLYGGVGLGKTHLMHAIAWHIKQSKQKRSVVYLSAERFMQSYITSIRSKNIMLFKKAFRSVDVLMVDDVQFISGKESTQEEFFHTFNTLIEQSKQLVISADRSPNDLKGVEERIQSRLSWGLVADINHTTFELRLGILESKLENIETKQKVSKKVLEFIAKNVISNVRELEGALNKVIANASVSGQQITVDYAKDVLADILRTNSIVITLDSILLKCSEHFNVKISDLRSSRRLRNISSARQICMYLAKTLTQKSLLEIGKFFGGRDHATVIHSVKRIESLTKQDSQIAEDIRIITKKLK